MPDTLTAFFGFTKPALHSTGWGPKANTDFDQWDSVLGIPRGAYIAPTVGATTTLALATGSAFAFTLNQSITTLLITGAAANPAGVTTQVWQKLTLLVIGDGTRRTIGWPGSVTWLTGQVPVLTPGGSDFFEFFTKDNGVTWLGIHHDVIDLPSVVAATYNASATTHIALGSGRYFKYTVSGNISTIAFDDATKNTPTFKIAITNGGLFAQTWPGSVTWLSGSAPVLQQAGVDVLSFFSPDGGTTWYGAHIDAAVTSDHCKANRSAALAVPQTTDTVIPFTAADSYDTNNLHDPVSNPSRVTVPAGGWAGSEAEIVSQVQWASNQFTEDLQQVHIRKNANGVGNAGTELARTTLLIGNDSITPHSVQVSAYDDSPIAGDYYEVFISTNRSGGISVSSAWVRLARKR